MALNEFENKLLQELTGMRMELADIRRSLEACEVHFKRIGEI